MRTLIRDKVSGKLCLILFFVTCYSFQRYRDGKEVVQQQEAIPQSDYQKTLDAGLPASQLTSEAVRYWSDYNRLFYHPRSIVQLNDYELNSRTMPFEDWDVGDELFNNLDKEHDLIDRDVRPFAEECDQLRAIQIFTNADDAWGGFAARYIDRLRDEYGKKSIWVWAIESGSKVQRVSLHIIISGFAWRYWLTGYSTTKLSVISTKLGLYMRYPPRLPFIRLLEIPLNDCQARSMWISSLSGRHQP